MLIAIISKTFQEFNEEKDLKDIEGLLDIFIEISVFVRLFSQISCTEKDEDLYLHIISCKDDGKNMLEDLVHRLDGIIKVLIYRYREEYQRET